MKHLIVGDGEGYYFTHRKLKDRVEKDLKEEIRLVSCGDTIDRGPMSSALTNYLMNNGHLQVQSNHIHMLLDFLGKLGGKPGTFYDTSTWLMNGGITTANDYAPGFMERHGKLLESFQSPFMQTNFDLVLSASEDLIKHIPKEHIEYWLQLPYHLDIGDCIVTHAPINPILGLTKDMGFLWNRGTPRRIKDKIQVHGHNSVTKVVEYTDVQGIFGYNVDTSRANMLTGILAETKQLFAIERDG